LFQHAANANIGAWLSTSDPILATALTVRYGTHKPSGLLPSVGFALQRDNLGIFSKRDALNIFQPCVKVAQVFLFATQGVP
jgi:hypothetical protein